MIGNLSSTVLTLSWILLIAPLPGASQRASTVAVKSQTKAPDQIHWIRYNDSAEGAFTMDVPLGWQVQGGMYRFGYFDVRWEMGVRSLDGKIIIRIDDVNVPPYALPGPTTGREGQPYIKPQQYQMVVERFQQPKAYAEVYAKHRFGDICKSMTPAASAWSPTLPASWGDPKTPASNSSVAYSCETSDGPRVATVFTSNTLFQGQNYGFWIATPISVLCLPERCAQAESMTQHMIDSWEKNPQWTEHQNQMTQLGLQRIRENFGQFMQQMRQFHEQFTQSMNQQVAGYYAHQNAQAKQVSSWCDTINGENVTDPKTGTQFKVFTGPKHNYYENGLGVKVNSDVSPGPDFHQLQVNPE